MRKLKTQKELPDSPAGFPVAVCEFRTSTGNEVIAWFKTERDAKIFAEAEKEAAEFKIKLQLEQAKTASAYRRAYNRGCFGQ